MPLITRSFLQRSRPNTSLKGTPIILYEAQAAALIPRAS
jgi:hypothetical protein